MCNVKFERLIRFIKTMKAANETCCSLFLLLCSLVSEIFLAYQKKRVECSVFKDRG